MTTIRILGTSLAAIILGMHAAMAKTYVWNTNVTNGDASEPTNWLVDGVVADVAPGSNDDVVIQPSMTNYVQSGYVVTFGDSCTFKSLALSGSVFANAGSMTINAEKLILGAGCPKLYCDSSAFGKFETMGACAVLETKPGAVTITDKSSVKTYNGVAPHFVSTSSNGGPCEILKLADDGTLVEAGDSEYVTDIESAGENDSVYLTNASSNYLLTKDVTINALKIHNGIVLDLGGHTLTVKSGVIRPRRDNNKFVYYGTISNGTVKVCDQFFYINGTGADKKNFNVTLDTTWNTDPLKQVFAYRLANNDWEPISRSDMSKFFGIYCTSLRISSSMADATNLILDTRYGTLVENGYFGANSVNANLRGIAGHSSVVSKQKFNNRLWLGDEPDFNSSTVGSCVVGSNGYLVPGSIAYDGFREGSLSFDDSATDGRCYTKLIVNPGSHLVTTLRADGRATKVTTTGTSQYRCKVTLNGGNLDVIEAGKVKKGAWTIMRTVDPVVGSDGTSATAKFDNVTAGFKVKYNVEVVEDGATYYEIQLTKKASGSYITLR